ncbi:diacylglycerol acyltransferase type 2A [Absidia repens]|uniref:Diacylglycerol O-acyltransferase n=1 Tax=Absidia repens TaxID=90262 RepID=A0A1X2IXD0_9FUNG|nr:diacylglycerol acyltransferase type 2A [Absidia repens]
MITTTKKVIPETISLTTAALTKTNHHNNSLDQDDLNVPEASLITAPLSIPWERRLQMGSVIVWLTSSFYLMGLFLWFWTRPFWFPLAILYLAYLLLDRAPVEGGRPFPWVREWSLWKHIVDFFPIQIIKEQNLDPSCRYIFGCHPHGIACFGPLTTFGTEASGFSRLFPGINTRLATLPVTFMVPLYRDLLLSMGLCSISRASCDHVLSSSGLSLAIVVGGATEALVAQPGTNQLILKKRLGFIRLAIRHNATLVPVFSFGEADMYHQSQSMGGSLGQTLRSWVKQICGISFPLFHARGIFNYDFGLVPYRKPVTIIVGRPIAVPKLEKDQAEPTKEQLLEVQERYIKELIDIYDKYKDVYSKDRHQDLEIIA